MSTPNSRILRVAKTTRISRMVINDQSVIILNPTICQPWKTYRLELDFESSTAWIREEGAS